jgi:predicted nucleotidyltransferase component of viral defense system
MLPDKEIIEDAAIELGVDPSFIEKDWHAVEVLKVVSSVVNGSHSAIFSGGTSLSKGFNLIKRFSEDLDFYVKSSDPKTVKRADLRAYRSAIWEAIEGIPDIAFKENSQMSRNNSLFFSAQLIYPQIFAPNDALRPELKVEFTFQNPQLPPTIRQLHTMVDQLAENSFDTPIPCIRPEETGSDKFSALTWRVLTRDRTRENDDPALVRHLHDLHALNRICTQDRNGFMSRVIESYDNDKQRGKLEDFDTIVLAGQTAFEMMRDDTIYAAEYSLFVDSMSYARENEKISFNMALESFESLVTIFR